ncbi:hypothetical protein D1872_293990 [compost metagenome]
MNGLLERGRVRSHLDELGGHRSDLGQFRGNDRFACRQIFIKLDRVGRLRQTVLFKRDHRNIESAQIPGELVIRFFAEQQNILQTLHF